MLKIATNSLLLITVILTVVGCASDPIDTESMTLCTNPRPEVCTMEYDPVCGFTEDGHRTYASGCTACSDKEVIGYKQGACKDTERG